MPSAAIRSPLLRISTHVWIKAECLQPTGSFKIRGASAAYAVRGGTTDGPLVTVSAGNMGRAVAYVAAGHGRPCRVYVPDHAPAAKLGPIEALGAVIERRTFAEWWALVASGESPLPGALFIHPFLDTDVIAGNATIADEIDEGFDVVLVPWGGGGLAVGVAGRLRERMPQASVHAVEVSTAAPLAAAWDAGAPVEVGYEATFVDGIGSTTVLAPMYEAARELLAGVIVVSPDEAAEGVRVAARDARVVVEGAAGCAVAAAFDGRFEGRRVLSIASGGNLNPDKLASILKGEGT